MRKFSEPLNEGGIRMRRLVEYVSTRFSEMPLSKSRAEVLRLQLTLAVDIM